MPTGNRESLLSFCRIYSERQQPKKSPLRLASIMGILREDCMSGSVFRKQAKTLCRLRWAGESPKSTRARLMEQKRRATLMHRVVNRNRRMIGRYLACACLWTAAVLTVHAQGVLTVTPGRIVTTNSGTGTVGYAGDGGAATSATLASPSAIAYDANGNLFIADTLNHVIREISSGGAITTVAGTGIAGFGGDGASATLAYLD